MGFEVIDGNPHAVWVPVAVGETLYGGQLVRCNNEGAIPLAQASGEADQGNHVAAVGLISDGASANNVLYGVVIGNNARDPIYNSTYQAEQISYLTPVGVASNTYGMAEDEDPSGDGVAKVHVALINSTTILRGRLFNGAYGTVPTETALSGTPDTVSATSAAVDAAGVASMSTLYFRNGTAARQYRITDDTSTTALTWDLPVGTAAESGDKVVRVAGLRPKGMGKIQIDSEATYIDVSDGVATNNFIVNVIRLDLAEAGKETVDFQFSPYHFICFDDLA